MVGGDLHRNGIPPFFFFFAKNRWNSVKLGENKVKIDKKQGWLYFVLREKWSSRNTNIYVGLRLVTKTKTYSFLFLYFAAFHLILAAMFFRNLDNSENRRIVAKIWKWYFKQAYNILYNRVINRFSNICFFKFSFKNSFWFKNIIQAAKWNKTT